MNVGSSCVPTLECRTNCSNCPKGLGIGITPQRQCENLEGAVSLRITDQSEEVYNYTTTTIHNYKTNSGCFCKFPFSAVAVNKCGETTMLESPPCTNGKISSEMFCLYYSSVGTNLDNKNEMRAMAMPLTSSQILFTFTTLLGIIHPLH